MCDRFEDRDRGFERVVGRFRPGHPVRRRRESVGGPELEPVMHMENRGVQAFPVIESGLADSPQSVITSQVTNGVAIRMAILTAVTQAMESL